MKVPEVMLRHIFVTEYGCHLWLGTLTEKGYGGVNWSHRGPRYQGGLGFYSGSWDAYKPKGYPDNAGDATWRQQMVTANRLWARAGWGWGCDKR